MLVVISEFCVFRILIPNARLGFEIESLLKRRLTLEETMLGRGEFHNRFFQDVTWCTLIVNRDRAHVFLQLYRSDHERGPALVLQ